MVELGGLPAWSVHTQMSMDPQHGEMCGWGGRLEEVAALQWQHPHEPSHPPQPGDSWRRRLTAMSGGDGGAPRWRLWERDHLRARVACAKGKGERREGF